MSYSKKNVLLMLAGVLIASQGWAQDDQNAATAYSERQLDEIVVYGSQAVAPAFVDPRYDEFLREQLQDQIASMRLEEETEWRSGLTYPLSDDPTILLGYDPMFDRERRQDLDFTSGPGDTVKTATLVRVGF